MGEALLDSKSMKLVLISIGSILAVVALAAVVSVVFGKEIPYVSEAIAGITGNSGIGIYRNVRTDGPIRQAQAGTMQLPSAITEGAQP